MDKWKVLKDEVYAESKKAMQNKDFTSYLAFNKVWARMIDLSLESEKIEMERILKKYDL